MHHLHISLLFMASFVMRRCCGEILTAVDSSVAHKGRIKGALPPVES